MCIYVRACAEYVCVHVCVCVCVCVCACACACACLSVCICVCKCMTAEILSICLCLCMRARMHCRGNRNALVCMCTCTVPQECIGLHSVTGMHWHACVHAQCHRNALACTVSQDCIGMHVCMHSVTEDTQAPTKICPSCFQVPPPHDSKYNISYHIPHKHRVIQTAYICTVYDQTFGDFPSKKDRIHTIYEWCRPAKHMQQT